MSIALREELIEQGKVFQNSGLTVSSGGNLSVRIAPDRFVITPSGMDYDILTVDDLVEMDFQGNCYDAKRRPSSEWQMHAKVYERHEDAKAVLHTHSPDIGALACMELRLPAIHYLVGVAGGDHVPLAPYRLYGTEELAEVTVNHMGNLKAVIMAHHGLLCYGKDMKQALDMAMELEFCAGLYLKSLALNRERVIPASEMKKVLEKFQTHGQGGRRR